MSENHQSITLAPGIDLQIDRDRVLDVIAENQIVRACLVFDRDAQLTELSTIVQHLVEDAGAESERHLDRILEALGWSATRTATIAELAAAVETIAKEVVDGPALALGLEVAQLEQHKWWGRREEIRARETVEVAA
jgi:hypothetical protein